jgi:hypothetical protein
MRRMSVQQVAMLARVADDCHPIPHEWAGARRSGADRTLSWLRGAGMLALREPCHPCAPYVLTDAGWRALGSARSSGAAAAARKAVEAQAAQ